MQAYSKVSPPRAFVRALSTSFSAALGQRADAPTIDIALAQLQHTAYVAALEAIGVAVTVLPADPRFPDGCFIEDNAVIAQGRALITRSGALARRDEVAATAKALAPHLVLHHVEPPATIDGGDVLRVGRHFFVGQSSRTNAAGADAMKRCFEPAGFKVTTHPVVGPLHLKCHASSPVPGLVVMAPGALPDAALADVQVITVPTQEAYAANTLGHNNAVLVAAGYPTTAAALRAHGLDVHEVDVSQFALADGSLTCLSLLLG